VGVHVAYFRGQFDGRKLVTSAHRLVAREAQGWRTFGAGSAAARFGLLQADFARSEVLGPEGLPSSSRAHLVVWKAYWIDGHFVAGDARAKLFQAWARLRGRGDDGAIVVFYANEPSVTASDSALQAFVPDHLVKIDAVLQRARASGREP